MNNILIGYNNQLVPACAVNALNNELLFILIPKWPPVLFKVYQTAIRAIKCAVIVYKKMTGRAYHNSIISFFTCSD